MADNTTLPGTGDVVADEDIGGVKYQKMKLIDATKGSTSPIGINAAPLFTQDDSTILLRRIVKLLEIQCAADAQQRPRVTVDAITGALTLATVTTVGTVSAITAGTITTVSNAALIAGYNHMQFIDVARNAYANGIRSKLTFG